MSVFVPRSNEVKPRMGLHQNQKATKQSIPDEKTFRHGDKTRRNEDEETEEDSEEEAPPPPTTTHEAKPTIDLPAGRDLT